MSAPAPTGWAPLPTTASRSDTAAQRLYGTMMVHPPIAFPQWSTSTHSQLNQLFLRTKKHTQGYFTPQPAELVSPAYSNTVFFQPHPEWIIRAQPDTELIDTKLHGMHLFEARHFTAAGGVDERVWGDLNGHIYATSFDVLNLFWRQVPFAPLVNAACHFCRSRSAASHTRTDCQHLVCGKGEVCALKVCTNCGQPPDFTACECVFPNQEQQQTRLLCINCLPTKIRDKWKSELEVRCQTTAPISIPSPPPLHNSK